MQLAMSNLIFQSYADSDFFGKMIFFGLFILSVISWYVLLKKSWVLFKIKKKSAEYAKALEIQKGNILQISQEALPQFVASHIINPYNDIYQNIKLRVIELLKKNRFFLSQSSGEEANVFLTKSDLELIQNHLASMVERHVKELEKNLFVLSTVVSLAPFLGILGTVWGILISLFEMQKGGSFQSNSIILNGLSTALATTVIGLVIAIPALIAYSYLKNMIKQIYFDMNHFGHELVSNIELQYRNVESK
jgi:biopolymer transport protein TolQ